MGQGGAAPGGAVFVGRVGELGELTSALGQAKAGRGAMILLAGEPGIGKTRLVDELVARIEAGGATVFWGRCWEGGGAPAYWPWVQILRAASAGIEGALTEAQRSDVGHIVPDLFDRRDEPRTSSDPDADRFRSFEAVAACLRAAALRRSALVVVDDIHAADVPSLLLLRFLAADLRSIPMLLVATYRDTAIGRAHPLSEALPELMRDPSVRRMELRGLSQEDVGAYVVATAGDASDAVITAVHRETEGNPLFMSELLRLLLAEGRLEDVVNAGEHTRISVPQGVRDVIRRRVALLSERCADTLATASVL
ncbi:MAG: ATP-binding protein, partial [Gaiellaceae bacterium]